MKKIEQSCSKCLTKSTIMKDKIMFFCFNCGKLEINEVARQTLILKMTNTYNNKYFIQFEEDDNSKYVYFFKISEIHDFQFFTDTFNVKIKDKYVHSLLFGKKNDSNLSLSQVRYHSAQETSKYININNIFKEEKQDLDKYDINKIFKQFTESLHSLSLKAITEKEFKTLKSITNTSNKLNYHIFERFFFKN
jgi:predicted RNA-binding Zn-ribbon protein involved in translation (DUF1610 family)